MILEKWITNIMIRQIGGVSIESGTIAREATRAIGGQKITGENIAASIW